jgi:hypothetical protein
MIQDEDSNEFNIWLNNGIDRGWISSPFCCTHDGGPVTDEEYNLMDDGEDICLPHIKLLEN